VTGGVGFVAGSNVTNIIIACAPNHSIGGSVSNLVGTGLVLQNNSQDDLSVPMNASSFTFPTPVREGNAYSVTVKAQPTNPSQTCSVSGGGAGTVGTSDVTSVAVSCTTNTYTVSAAVTGNTSAVTLQLNGGSSIAPTAPGTYSFGPLASGASYSVAVTAQPSTPRLGATAGTRQRCLVSNPAGTVAASNVVVDVSCLTSVYEDFDDPVLLIPTGWTAATLVGTAATDEWAAYESGTPGPQSGLYYFFATPASHAVHTTLTTAPIDIVNPNARLTFWHYYNAEAGADGGYLAIKIGAAPFTDVLAAGCTFVDVGSGLRGYTGTISSPTNPIYLAGSTRAAWTGTLTPTAYVQVGLDLPASAAGQTVQLQWVWGSDSTNASAKGWIVDTVQVDR
jgi:hypothetical protein